MRVVQYYARIIYVMLVRIEFNLHLPPAVLFPLSNLLLNPDNHIFHASILSECVDKLSVWIHEIEKD